MFDWLPTIDSDVYWGVVCLALLALNVYQFARAHGLAVFKTLVEKHGHAPEGKVVVPVSSIARAQTTPAVPSDATPTTLPRRLV